MIHDHTHHRHADGSDCHCETETHDHSSAATEATDPVCGMTVTIANAKYTAAVSGQTYYFCCEACRTSFLANPSRYASQTGTLDHHA